MRHWPLLILAFIACKGKDDPKPRPITAETPLSDLSINDIVPTSGAGVYVDAEDVLWYIQGSTGIIVKTPAGHSINPCSIVPTSGEGVYVKECSNLGYWYVVKENAIAIRTVIKSSELDAVSAVPNQAVGAYWARRQLEIEMEAVRFEDAEPYDPR